MSEAFDELEQNVQDLQDAQSDLSDAVSSHEDALSDLNQTASDLQEQSGQLQYPLSQDTIDLIKEQFPVGVVTLVAGTVTLNDIRISASSIILFNRATAGGTLGNLSIGAQSAGSVTFISDSATETSDIYYLIM